jgi:hypothetical protein
MLITAKDARIVINKLIKTRGEFHTVELSEALSQAIGIHVETDLARYWANHFIIEGILDRRKISKRLFVYFKRPTAAASLSSSITIKRKS